MIEKYPAQIIPSAADGTPLKTQPQKQGGSAITVSADQEARLQLDVLRSIDLSMKQLVFIAATFTNIEPPGDLSKET